MLREGHSSALILEDDQDWDVRVREQMQAFAVGSRQLQGYQSSAETRSPYGDDWDVLWLGNCGEQGPNLDQPFHMTANDPTAPPRDQIWTPLGPFAYEDYRERTRFIVPTNNSVCSLAYGVSRRGAQSILYNIGVKGRGRNFDLGLRDVCQDLNNDGQRATAFTVMPPLFNSFNRPGPMWRDSDINGVEGSDVEIREKGVTHNIAKSVQMNIERLIGGLEAEDQYAAGSEAREVS